MSRRDTPNFDAAYYRDPRCYQSDTKICSVELAADSDEGVEADAQPKPRLYWVQVEHPIFYPEGGGQPGDTGFLVDLEDPHNRLPVVDTKLRNGVECLLVRLDPPAEHLPLREGGLVRQIVDGERRLCFARLHTGEHILSGLAHQAFGCQNTGFHMDEEEMVLDFDLPLADPQIRWLEEEANRIILENRLLQTEAFDLPVEGTGRAESEHQKPAPYRSKGNLSGSVRVVEIPGTDRCACCGLHVQRTGELGMLRITQAQKHRGGVRLNARCGLSAWKQAQAQADLLIQLGQRFSVPADRVLTAIQTLVDRLETVEQANRNLWLRHCQKEAESWLAQQDTESSLPPVFLFLSPEDRADADRAKTLLQAYQAVGAKLVTLFWPADSSLVTGTSEQGLQDSVSDCTGSTDSSCTWRYHLVSTGSSLQEAHQALRNQLGARGGGRPDSLQGTVTATLPTLKDWFSRWIQTPLVL